MRKKIILLSLILLMAFSGAFIFALQAFAVDGGCSGFDCCHRVCNPTCRCVSGWIAGQSRCDCTDIP